MDRPILFSTPMVKAILRGNKTQTRRMVKPQPNFPSYGEVYDINIDSPGKIRYRMNGDTLFLDIKNPYGYAGDRIWVRETWSESDGVVKYLADGSSIGTLKTGQRWKPSIHMPKRYCRLFLQINDIRLERLQDISEADCLAEGIERTHSMQGFDYYRDYINGGGDLKPLESFWSLWESINGQDSWNINPWVWVVKFEKLCQK